MSYTEQICQTRVNLYSFIINVSHFNRYTILPTFYSDCQLGSITEYRTSCVVKTGPASDNIDHLFKIQGSVGDNRSIWRIGSRQELADDAFMIY